MSTIRALSFLLAVPVAAAQELSIPESSLAGASVVARGDAGSSPEREDGGLVLHLEAPARGALSIPAGAIEPGRHALAIEVRGEVVGALVVEARGAEEVEAVPGPFSVTGIEGSSLTLTRDMPSAGWSFEVEGFEDLGRWIVVRAVEVRPEGMAAQAITPTPMRIDLAGVGRGRRVLVIETKRGRGDFVPAHALAIDVGD